VSASNDLLDRNRIQKREHRHGTIEDYAGEELPCVGDDAPAIVDERERSGRAIDCSLVAKQRLPSPATKGDKPHHKTTRGCYEYSEQFADEGVHAV